MSFPFARPQFVVNARASRGGMTPRLDALRAHVLRLAPSARWTLTAAAGDAEVIARAAARNEADLVVAVGGDGTINEVVNGLVTASAVPPPLGILPAGSGSDFVRTIGVPRDAHAAIEILARGRTRRIDIGEIECAAATSSNAAGQTRRYFVNIAGCGASGRVVERFNRRRIPGALGYGVAAALTAVDYRFPLVQVALDGAPAHLVRLNLLFVCNGEYCGGGMHVGNGARLDDGLFLVVEGGDVSRLRSMLQWPQLYRGGLHRVRGVRVGTARTITVTSAESALVDCDGELCGRLPATYRVLPGAISVCVPQE